MKDFLEKELSVGDEIVFISGERYLCKGTVTKLNKEKITVHYKGKWSDGMCSVYPVNVVKVSHA